MSDFVIKNQAVVGTLESSDLQIIIDRNDDGGIVLDLQSSVEFQYGKVIREVILETLDKLGVKDAKLSVIDKGALDCTIKARTISGVHRACGKVESINWEELESWNV